ncbi:MAG TPA: inosine monophosphate cyclohydrolase [Clostridiales bacterium]|jgi:IMP cyclohydrolase|nr:inosine monophosphate cyclohydrolase [Clostridiales bacterium]
MKSIELNDYLRNKSYPGRGIIIGTNDKGSHGVIAYFLMGRSENSRNRVFKSEGDGLRTEAFDPVKVTDPSLIIYSPVKVHSRVTIVTNGDQTDTIYDALLRLDAAKGNTEGALLTDSSQSVLSFRAFTEALTTRTFEPDAPNYTPRISGMLYAGGDFSSYHLSILKTAEGDPITCHRFYYSYQCVAGIGHFLHTYQVNTEPLPPFEGDPRPVTIRGNIDSFTSMLWKNLNTENKISLFVRYINLVDRSYEDRIINRHEEAAL